jgi:hypothetical protein
VDRFVNRVAAILASVVFSASVAGAQTLTSLHVRKFELSLDQQSVSVGAPFHLILTAHVDEAIAALDNVSLPNLAGLEDLGDERRCTRAKNGTDCVETLTLDATAPGDRTIGPATLAAVDAQTGRPRTFESNLVTIHVTGQPKIANDTEVTSAVTDMLWAAARTAGTFVLVALALWGLLWAAFRRPHAPLPPPRAPAPEPPPPPIPDWERRLRDAVDALVREPTRANAIAVREALRAHVGAREEETFADLVARNATNGRSETLAALAAVERAAFCEDARVPEAIREALPFLTH